MIYRPIRSQSDLPASGALDVRAREKQDLDFKSYADSKKMWEHAKDIAAFANALGGVVLVGADNESDPTVLKYPGVSGQTTAQVVAIYEHAAAMCSPPQSVDAVPIKGSGGVDLVAVNVDPFVEQPVASPAGHKVLGKVDDAWRFPIRRGSQTDFIAPQEIPLHSNGIARRAFLLLSRIPSAERSRVAFYFNVGSTSGTAGTGHRRLSLQVPDGGSFVIVSTPRSECRIPLSDIIDVWEQADAQWAVKVSGSVYLGLFTRRLSYVPRF